MTWTANQGIRPKSLKDDDKVFVRLFNGEERGPWTVTTRQGAIRWGLQSDDNPAHRFDIREWRRA